MRRALVLAGLACLGGGLVALAVLLLPSLVHADGPIFESKVKIPYAMSSGSKVLEPGEYWVKSTANGNDWTLTLRTLRGETVLRTTAMGGDVPKEERNFTEQFRLRIKRVADEKSPEKFWIVFELDYKSPRRFFRASFLVPEAAPRS